MLNRAIRALSTVLALLSLTGDFAAARQGVFLSRGKTLFTLVDGGLVEAGKLIYADDFSEGISKDWKLDASHMWKVKDGVLMNSRYGGTASLQKNLGNAFVIEVKLKPIACNPEKKGGFTAISVSGILFCTQTNRWWWQYKKPGAKRASGQWKVEEIPFGRWYDHKIIRRAGGVFEWFVDGRKICEIVEPEMKGGLKFQGWRIKSAYDDLRIYKIDEDNSSKADAGGINLVRNASFETFNDNLPPYWVPGVGNIPFTYGTVERFWKCWALDTSEKYHGERSLRLSGHKANRLDSYWSHVQKGRPYTFSVYLKSEAEGVPVYLSIPGARSIVKVGKDWRRYSLTTKKAKGERMRIHIVSKSEQTVWVDAVQLERGTQPTGFRLNPLDRRQHAKALKVSVAETMIPRIKTPPVIDGKLVEAAWAAAAEAPAFRIPTALPGRFRAPENKTEAYLCHDADYLYIAFKCFVPADQEVRAAAEKRPGTVWGTDCVEMFLDANLDRKTYFHLAVNAVGGRYSAAGGNSSWNPSWNAETSIAKGLWTVEVALPLAGLQITPLTGRRWGINLARGRACTAAVPRNTGMYFHAVEAYSLFKWEDPGVFKKYLCTVEGLRLLNDADGASALAGTLRNLTGKAIKVTLDVKTGSKSLTSGPLAVERGKTKRFSLGGFIRPQRGETSVILRLADASNGKLLREITGPVRLAGPMKAVLGRSYYTTEKTAKLHVTLCVSRETLRTSRLKITLKKDKDDIFKADREVRSFHVATDIPLGNLPTGDYKLAVTLSGPRGDELASRFLRLQKLKPKANEVKIDRISGALLVNCKPLFPFAPLQVFMQPRSGPYGNLDELIEKMMAYWAGLGFKVVFVGTNIDRIYSERVWDKVFEAARENGLKIIAFWTGQASKVLIDDKEKLKKFILRWRDEPALLAWMPEDEPEIKPLKPAQVAAAIREVKQFDPYHPVYINYTMMGPQSRYAGLPGDILSIDHYLTSVEGRTIRETLQYVDQMKAISAPDGIPVWNILVGNNLGNHTREISAEEQEAQTYANVIKGVTGLQYFLGQLAGRRHWKRFLGLRKEIETLSPILFSVDPVAHVDCTPSRVLTATRRFGGKIYLIAVNVEPEAVEATFGLFALSVKPDAEINVLFENRRLRAKAHQLRDRFAGFQRHVYEINP